MCSSPNWIRKLPTFDVEQSPLEVEALCIAGQTRIIRSISNVNLVYGETGYRGACLDAEPLANAWQFLLILEPLKADWLGAFYHGARHVKQRAHWLAITWKRL